MPVATLTFQLPDERHEHEDAVRGGEFRSALWDVEQRLRATLKHDDTLDIPTRKLLEELRELIPKINE